MSGLPPSTRWARGDGALVGVRLVRNISHACIIPGFVHGTTHAMWCHGMAGARQCHAVPCRGMQCMQHGSYPCHTPCHAMPCRAVHAAWSIPVLQPHAMPCHATPHAMPHPVMPSRTTSCSTMPLHATCHVMQHATTIHLAMHAMSTSPLPSRQRKSRPMTAAWRLRHCAPFSTPVPGCHLPPTTKADPVQ